MQILSQLGYFSEQDPIAHDKEREQCVSLFHIVSGGFHKGRHAEENFRETNRKMKIINSQMSLQWCDIFHKDRST